MNECGTEKRGAIINGDEKRPRKNPGPLKSWEETLHDDGARGAGVETREALEAEAGEVAVAQRNAGGRRQRTIDRGEQAGEERGVGREADSSSLGHGSSLSGVRPGGRLVVWE